MASGFLGLPNPWSASPMQSLTEMSTGQDPATTGAIPPTAAPAPMPAPAPAPAPAAPAGGGIGEAMSNMFSGRGIMGAQPGDDKIDPNTGATAGQSRAANMSSMMQFGLTLIAAGMNQSNDSRAAILAKAPGLLDNSDKINSFAKTRLLMADARLAERKQANQEQRQAGIAAYLKNMGGSGAATLAPAAAGGAPAPGAIAPIAPLAAAGGGEAVPLDISAGASTAPAAAAPPAAAPAAAAGGTPRMSRDELGALALMDPDKALDHIARRSGELAGTETMGAPFVDPQTGEKMAPVMKNGVQVRVQSIGKMLGAVSEEGGKRITRTGGTVTGIADVAEDPQDREERTASVGIRTKRAAALNDGRGAIEVLNNTLPRLRQAEKDVREGKTFTGFGAEAKEQAVNFMLSTGMLSSAGREALQKGANVDSLLKQSSGEFAKQYYGPQISNADVENAQKAIGGLKSGDHAVVADSLKRIREGYVQKIDGYNKDADDHNDRLSGIRSEGLRKDLEARKVERQRAPDEYSDAERAQARAELARRRAAQGAR